MGIMYQIGQEGQLIDYGGMFDVVGDLRECASFLD